MDDQDQEPATKGFVRRELHAFETRILQEIRGVDGKTDGLDAKVDGLTTRVDGLDAKVDRIAVKVVTIEGQLGDMRRDMATKEDINRLINTVDGFSGKLESYGRETATIPHALDRHGETLKDHERRLKRLEGPGAP